MRRSWVWLATVGCCAGLVVEKYQSFPWSWLSSWAGLLMAGELFLDFTNPQTHQLRLTELQSTLQHTNSGAVAVQATAAALPPADVFISYCWKDSFLAYEASQIPKSYGNMYGRFDIISTLLRQLLRQFYTLSPPKKVPPTWDLGFASWAFGLRPHMGPT